MEFYMDNAKIRQRLEELAEEKYRDFSQSLVPGCRPMLGVRIPALRKLAKEIAGGDWKSYLENASDDSFEEVNLQGFVTGYARADFDTILPYIKGYVEKINDWSLCDGFCATLKVIGKNRENFIPILEEYAKEDSEFKQRFVAVILMDYYLTDEYIDYALKLIDTLEHPGYYRQMGVAWMVATAFAKYREQTLAYLKNNNMDNFTYNKAIQKMLESYRVSDEDKKMLRNMKIPV